MTLIPIHETFQQTLQGEGYWAGSPVDFVRLAGCPLSCSFCDTGYADGGKNTPRTERSIDDLVSETRSPRVVISGGEPFIHKQLPALVDALELTGKQVCIETSGAFWQPVSATAWVTLSPKQHISPKYPVHPVMWLRADEIKIVIATGVEVDFYDRHIRYWSTDWHDWASQHLKEFEAYLQRLSPTKHIFLQPEWGDRERTLPLVLNLLQKHPNMRLSVQLHKLIGVQ
jgi:organic radical activating enzyme